jgi:hypothetical protein
MHMPEMWHHPFSPARPTLLSGELSELRDKNDQKVKESKKEENIGGGNARPKGEKHRSGESKNDGESGGRKGKHRL